MASDEIRAALAAENARLREALAQAGAWFFEYADSHVAQGKTDKAERNLSRANFCRAALAGKETCHDA